MKKEQTTQSPLTLELSASEVLLGWLYLGVEFLVLPTAIYALGSMFGGFSATTSNIIFYIVNAISCGVIFRKVLVQSLVNAGQDFKRLLNAVVMGYLSYFIASALMGTVIIQLFPDFSNVNNNTILAMLDQQPVLMAVCVVVLAPFAEECLFRGVLFLPFAKRSVFLGYLVSCLGFAAVHIMAYIGSFDAVTLAICFIQYLPAGACLAWACRKSDSLFAPILIHAAINFLSTMLTR